MIIGVIDQSNSKTVYTYSSDRFKTFSQYPEANFTQYELDAGTYESAYSWNGSEVVFDSEYVQPSEALEIIVARKIQEAIEFGENLLKEFAAENIGMGITYYGKTRPVLSLMCTKFDLGDGYPLSVMDAIQSGSLYEAVAVIDHIITNIADYAALSPFITADRLNVFKSKITEFLA